MWPRCRSPHGAFEASLNVVTLECVREPGRVLAEIARALAPGTYLLIAPHEWEEHQQPHDYYRYTRYRLSVPAMPNSNPSRSGPSAGFPTCCRGGSSTPSTLFPTH